MAFSICNCKFMVLGFHHYARSLEKDKKIQRRHRLLVIKVCKLSVHKVLLFQKKYWYKMYSKMSVEGFEKLIEEFRNECNNER